MNTLWCKVSKGMGRRAEIRLAGNPITPPDDTSHVLNEADYYF